MNRTTVLLLFGGESPEHEVSIASARNVYAALDDEKYDVRLGFIDKHGKWWLLPSLDGEVTSHGHPQLVPVLGSRQFMTLPESTFLRPDVLLPVMHGEGGEDGTVQGLARLMHIPIVGCGVLASAVAMDKIMSKHLFQEAGIPVVPFAEYRAHDPIPPFRQLVTNLGSPFFVKPATLGSSVGVSKVHSEEEYHKALETALGFSSKVLIEQGIIGQELEVAALGSTADVEVSNVGEVKPDREFYSYESKYDPQSTSQLVIPADIPPTVAEDIRIYAKKAFQVLECSGLSRVDFFYSSDGTIYVNEVNTFPGFTNISMYPKLWQERGVHYPALIERLIQIALDK